MGHCAFILPDEFGPALKFRSLLRRRSPVPWLRVERESETVYRWLVFKDLLLYLEKRS